MSCLCGYLMLMMPTGVRGETPRQGDEARLIAELGDSDFRIREAASKALTASPRAAPWVRRATKNSDPEVVSRARLILGGYTRQRLAAQAPAVQTLPVDAFLEWYLAWSPPQPDNLWQPGFDFGRRGVAAVGTYLPANAKSVLGETVPKSLEQLKSIQGDPVRSHSGPEAGPTHLNWLGIPVEPVRGSRDSRRR